MAIRFVCADGQAGVEEEDAAVGPGGQEPAVARGRGERRIVLFDCCIYILERRGGWGRRPDGEAEAVGLVEVVVGVLAEDHGLHVGKRRVPGPCEEGGC